MANSDMELEGIKTASNALGVVGSLKLDSISLVYTTSSISEFSHGQYFIIRYYWHS
jgi:hypothetical protein